MTSADVLFSFRALYDPEVNSARGGADRRQAARGRRAGRGTVVLRFPGRSRRACASSTACRSCRSTRWSGAQRRDVSDAWSADARTEIAGLGPFILAEHARGQRLVFTRNPHYWRRDAAGVSSPYLDRLTLVLARSERRSAADEVRRDRPDDERRHPPGGLRASSASPHQGRLRLIDVGASGSIPTCSGSTCEPLHAAIRATPGCGTRHSVRRSRARSIARPSSTRSTSARPCRFRSDHAGQPDVVRRRASRRASTIRAPRALLASAGLTDRNGDGMLEDAAGTPALLDPHAGRHLRERVASMLQEQLRQVGLAVDIVPSIRARSASAGRRATTTHLLRRADERDRSAIRTSG